MQSPSWEANWFAASQEISHIWEKENDETSKQQQNRKAINKQELQKEQEQQNQLQQKGKQYLPSNKTYV